jgi:hypothetical protein
MVKIALLRGLNDSWEGDIVCFRLPSYLDLLTRVRLKTVMNEALVDLDIIPR